MVVTSFSFLRKSIERFISRPLIYFATRYGTNQLYPKTINFIITKEQKEGKTAHWSNQSKELFSLLFWSTHTHTQRVFRFILKTMQKR